MRNLCTLALVALFITAPLGMSTAQMYWTPGEERELTVPKDEFNLEFGRDVRAPSFKDREVYDYQEPEFIEPQQEPTPTTAARPAVRPQRTIEEPRPSRVVPRAVRRERSVTPGPRSTEPRPAPAVIEQGEKKQVPTPVTAPTDQAEKKNMQWGKVEVKPVEPTPEKKKLQWGKTENQ